jgi:hypothetical protein
MNIEKISIAEGSHGIDGGRGSPVTLPTNRFGYRAGLMRHWSLSPRGRQPAGKCLLLLSVVRMKYLVVLCNSH